jgi:hypothetical protein
MYNLTVSDVESIQLDKHHVVLYKRGEAGLENDNIRSSMARSFI